MHERVMIFVDGSNLLRGIAQELKVKTDSLKPSSDELTLAFTIVSTLWSRLDHDIQVGAINGRVVRRYWFGSYQGNEEVGNTMKQTLRKANFEPILFNVPQAKKGKEKRVDIAIAREMLINSFNRNMEIAVLVAGDEDYVDLVNDIKRYGVRVTGSFFPKSGSSPNLQLAVDYFHSMAIWGERHIELTKAIKAANQAL